ncbi:TetR/AcrR family transcriptional regulator [Bacillus sp. APMAM]|nr:TetR/AcrR family transcriptional regulator [Bacillus sp. APMAM]RTZ54043.1 TetR/AcrR family transcriptional regulator [Bacillus sp. SAJ1]
MSPRKSVEKELSKEQILNAARNLFSAKGFQEVSMRDIAKELGCSHGAIYYHFKNKIELFNQLLQAGFNLLDSIMESIVSDEHSLKDILLGFVDFGFKYPHHYEIMFITKEDAFLLHSAPLDSYKRFEDEVMKFNVISSEVYFIFVSLHGFVSYHLRSEQFLDRGMTIAEQFVDFLIKNIQI